MKKIFIISLMLLSTPCFAEEIKLIDNTSSYLGYNSIVSPEEVKDDNIKYVIENKKSFLLINRITIKQCCKEQNIKQEQ